ncbi:hypothetical protein BGZ76_002966 [Entomortierella beljakovae]|nr:hypothetical protein BGZ76_002966 [Entomortierella beljakovae]
MEKNTFDSQFKVGPVLGTGTFASVYSATEIKSKKVYAVKIVKKSENLNLKLTQSLEREIGTLMCIDHPNLLRIHKVFNEETRHYLVTELARGGELFDRVQEKQKFSEAESRIVFRQLLSGVKYLHDRGIVHRDLKLENVLLMDKNSLIVKISDFGLANIVGEQKFLSTICGTPSYVAPEVIRNQEYGKAVDMWSLGVILYIFLCGFPPFSEELAPPKLRIQVLEGVYTFPSPYWNNISDEAVDLIQDLLLSDSKLRLTVDGALDHTWMHLKDNQGTLPDKARTEIVPKVNALVAKLTSQSMSSIDEANKGRESSLSASPVPPGDESDTEFNFSNNKGYKSYASPSTILQPTPTQGSGSQFWSPEGSFRAAEPDTLMTDLRAKKKRRV